MAKFRWHPAGTAGVVAVEETYLGFREAEIQHLTTSATLHAETSVCSGDHIQIASREIFHGSVDEFFQPFLCWKHRDE